MLKSTICSVLSAAALCLAGAAAAQDYSEGSEAKGWGLVGEAQARFTAEVVDPLCLLTGDCADNCGDGRRQLGLLREADDELLFVMKNRQPVFTGGVAELLPFCGQMVEVDGLELNDEQLGSQNLYLVQLIRAAGDAEWTKASQWTKDWAAAHPEAKGKGPWFRRDPRVNAQIEAEGWLGLGPENDTAVLEEWFE
ncbi:MAG: hypothetical protein AAGE76_08075 [Pseudomonadota bacterium]